MPEKKKKSGWKWNQSHDPYCCSALTIVELPNPWSGLSLRFQVAEHMKLVGGVPSGKTLGGGGGSGGMPSENFEM